MARIKQNDLKRLTLNLPGKLIAYIDEFAKDNMISRTTAITVLLSYALRQEGYGNDK